MTKGARGGRRGRDAAATLLAAALVVLPPAAAQEEGEAPPDDRARVEEILELRRTLRQLLERLPQELRAEVERRWAEETAADGGPAGADEIDEATGPGAAGAPLQPAAAAADDGRSPGREASTEVTSGASGADEAAAAKSAPPGSSPATATGQDGPPGSAEPERAVAGSSVAESAEPEAALPGGWPATAPAPDDPPRPAGSARPDDPTSADARPGRQPAAGPATDADATSAGPTPPRCDTLDPFDSNGDGEITAADRYWRHLRLWRDDGDGRLERSEITTPFELGIRRIDVRLRSFDGKKRASGDVWLDERVRFDLRGRDRSALLAIDADALARSRDARLTDAAGRPLSGLQLVTRGVHWQQGDGEPRPLRCGG